MSGVQLAENQTRLNVELEDALTVITSQPEAGFVLGFVTHASNIAETNLVDYAELFSTLDEHNVQLDTVSNVMQQFQRTREPAIDSLAEHPCHESDDISE